MMAAKTIELKSPAEIAVMRSAGRVVAEILKILESAAVEGMTTLELDQIAQAELKRRGAKPAFLGYRGFPAALCVSVNAEVVHGIPSSRRRIKAGDLVSLDFGCVVDGFCADAAVTVGVGTISPQARRLMDATRESLALGIAAAKPEGRVGDISSAVQVHVESCGFSVVRDFVGHGIGRALHEEPPVPNFGRAGTGPRLSAGMALAIEPMVAAGGYAVDTLDDGWTAVTRDGSLAAHFEHTVVLTQRGAEILTEASGA